MQSSLEYRVFRNTHTLPICDHKLYVSPPTKGRKVDVHNMYEAFLKASIPSSEPYNKALLKLSYYINYNMNIPFTISFNPDDYLPYFQLQSNKFISETLYGYSYL
jgi:hypothetical protein